MKVFAHRGSSGRKPEMTEQAYLAAIEDGAAGFECDVRLSGDRQVVCIHDANTKRVGTRKIRVSSSSLKELREVANVITLEELIKIAIKSKRDLLIETKHPVAALGNIEVEVLKVLDKYSKQIQGSGIEIIVMSFSWFAVKRIIKQFQGCKVSKYYLPALLTRTNVAALGLDLVKRRPGLVAKLQAKGIRVFLWTVNKKSELELCKELKIDGVITDYPKRAVRNV